MSDENLSCSEAQSALENIKSLKREFDRAFEDAVRTGHLEHANKLRSDLESHVRNLRESLITPIELKLDLKNQYESQRNILKNAGILEQLSSNESGIFGIDGKEYPMPSYQAIRDLVREKKDVLDKKAEQGFTRLLVVPFGMRLDDLILQYRAMLLRHKLEDKLFGTKEKESDSDEPLDLDVNDQVWIWAEYREADVNGKLVYDPKGFNRNHGGKTKKDILAAAQGKLSPVWRVILIESDPNIPREMKGIEIGGRHRIETNRAPNEYLALIGRNEYKDETGMTPEEWLVQAISYLEENNQVIDDCKGRGSIAYNTGAYFPASDSVPCAYWFRSNRQAFLNGREPTSRFGSIGARSVVRL